MNLIIKPSDIEKKSFSIITQELGDRTFPAGQEEVVKRVIHTTADFDYADNLCFSEDAIESAKDALSHGATIITDTTWQCLASIKPFCPVLADKFAALWQTNKWLKKPRPAV